MEDVTMVEDSPGLFEELSFTIIPNGLSEERLKKIETDIAASNGTIIPFDAPKGRIDRLKEVAYIVSETSDFPDYYRALDLLIHVVKPAWVEASLQAMKVKNPRTYSPDPALFMNEVVICCGNIPTGDKEAIEGGVLAMGGQIAPALSKQVTHLIALDLDDPRCQLAVSKRLQAMMVLPHWFDDCLKVGRRISERPYTLPDPEILIVEAGAIPSTRTSPQIRDATTPDPIHDSIPLMHTIHSEAPRAIKAFADKRLMFGDDLNLSSKLLNIFTGMIEAGGGSVTNKVTKADIYICNYREGPDYIKASQDGKDVGNLGWLYYLITHGVWTNPMRRMLHYPRPRRGIPGFEKYKVSISSYTGEARVYLENMVKASGAEFTKTFKQDNTHLITAHKNSEKCEAAAEWGVDVVNHLWLEDSYAKCREMPLTDNRYTYFPPRTNLGEILGQTEIDRDAMDKLFFPESRRPAKAVKAAVNVNVVPASSLPVRKEAHETVDHSSPVTDKTKRTKSTGNMQTPLPPRHLDGKENLTPGSRGAKDRALSKLHDAAPDIAQFEKEMKRKGGVIHGGRRRVEDENEDRSKKGKDRDSVASKRSIDEVDEDGEDEVTEDEVTEAPSRYKKAKKSKLTPIKFRMLVTKIERWIDNSEKESKDKARLRELGLFITDDFKKVDLVCAPQPVRTKKFIAALACAPTLVSTSYLDYALKHDKLPPAQKHLLEARDFEEANSIRLTEAVERAKQNKHRLLKDWTIFCTENVGGGFDTYKDIIEVNGGKCSLWKGRTTTVTASKRPLNTSDTEVSQNQEEDEGDILYLISDPDKKEFANWAKFRELAKKHDMNPRIVKTEWMLFVAMAQYVHWDPEWELSEDVVKAAK
ncbi:BRCT domain-containing protein [Cucurbitaria berberidis CBS 394.84]|uniref:BRCT domain-containing protein n=1 Tax=Cucurbitaria berberidis CBS 394.84 TaxID=1168544 RepID=A0A9P4G887_9PLEO|nr:BRCT domain-containing protein [Cucurbitaria berberidis CBS 394.84]KAF1840888.1 BRCT domain-containing protein [Cucurbitaria berberidis CBS 394.84]